MSNNQTKKLLCYSHEDFDHLMFKNGWSERPPRDVAIISIASHLDENPYHHFMYTGADNVLNIDFCDCTPEEWWGRTDRYDELFDFFILNKSDKMTNEDNRFSHSETNGDILNALNYEQACCIVRFIDSHIQRGVESIYLHCSAGKSRSQGVVRYVLDSYPQYDWKTNPDNPCLTPNYHVVRMLKRAFNFLFCSFEL